ncbi:DNA-3-methyladenine glycosylase [soil metagenome]
MKLPREFYTRADVVQISKALLGKYLFTRIDGNLSSGIIVETEAYCGRGDKACHANNKRTPRTEVMYAAGGKAYVYLCYGIHHLFNVVTNEEGSADAVLIRALEPVHGLDWMLLRREYPQLKPALTAGPGAMSAALGITTKLYGQDLLGDTIWIEDHGMKVKEADIIASPRVGVQYAEEDALRPWRFRIKGNTYTSPAK